MDEIAPKVAWTTVSPVLYPRKRVYFVCFMGRVGSSYLCELMSSTKVMGAPREYYNLSGCYNEHKQLWNISEDSSFFEAMINRTASENGVAGVKVNTLAFDFCLKHRPWWFDYFDVRYIYIERRDTMRQAISLYRALKSGQWGSPKKTNDDGVPFSVPEICAHEQRILEARQHWIEWFDDSGIEPYHIWYEDLCREPNEIIEEIADHLSVELPPNLQLRSTLQIMRDEKTEQWAQMLNDHFSRETGSIPNQMTGGNGSHQT